MEEGNEGYSFISGRALVAFEHNSDNRYDAISAWRALADAKLHETVSITLSLTKGENFWQRFLTREVSRTPLIEALTTLEAEGIDFDLRKVQCDVLRQLAVREPIGFDANELRERSVPELRRAVLSAMDNARPAVAAAASTWRLPGAANDRPWDGPRIQGPDGPRIKGPDEPRTIDEPQIVVKATEHNEPQIVADPASTMRKRISRLLEEQE